MTKLTKRHINLAAKIYSLSIIALDCNTDAADNDDEEYIVRKAIKDAENKFNRMFPNEKSMPRTLPECVELARRS